MKDIKEQEVKLEAPPGFRLPRLEGLVDGLTVSPMPRRSLSATYYDTKDLRLARWGITMRYRTGDGSGWTLKLPEGDGGPALVRRELTFGGTPAAPPPELLDLVCAYVRGEPIVKVARLRTTRTGMQLRSVEGEPQLEIVDDRVVVFDGTTITRRFRQLEVEAEGERGATFLSPVTDRLVAAGAKPDDVGPKLVHALGPRAAGSPEVPPVRLHSGSQAGDAVRAAMAAGAARMLRHDPGVRIGDDPEDVHQMRVATRRLRSDMRTFRPLLDQAQSEPLRAELKWIADLLGDNRDADVLMERLRKDADRLPQRDAGAVGAMFRRLAGQRDEARSRLLEGLRSDRYVALVDRLVSFAQVPPLVGAWADNARAVLPSLVTPTWKHLRNAVADLDDEPAPEDLHAIRIKAKRCRYAAEAVAPALGKEATKMASAIADVQGLLGDHHDAHVAEGWLRDTAAAAGTDANQALAAGELIAMQRLEATDLERQWPKTWKKASDKSLRKWLG